MTNLQAQQGGCLLPNSPSLAPLTLSPHSTLAICSSQFTPHTLVPQDVSTGCWLCKHSLPDLTTVFPTSDICRAYYLSWNPCFWKHTLTPMPINHSDEVTGSQTYRDTRTHTQTYNMEVEGVTQTQRHTQTHTYVQHGSGGGHRHMLTYNMEVQRVTDTHRHMHKYNM